MSKLWEVDPETRSKLQDIQKTNGNNRCVDCGAPSPQWASPKLGIFFCLACSGTHRSLGVHISFVRSITMDSFKRSEVQRMEHGGNQPWKDFFDADETNKREGRTFEDSTIQERYDSVAGEEWKEKLTCAVEDRDYVPGTATAARQKQSQSRSDDADDAKSSIASPMSGGGIDTNKKEQNEAYFARLGEANANKPDDLPPSQGGKFTGFGNTPMAAKTSANAMPSTDEFQKDPVAALTKGFGWLGSTVSKQATAGYTGWVKPNVQKLAEGDLAEKARIAATQVGQNIQAGTRTAAESLNRLVEGEGHSASAASSDPEKRDFWDGFGAQPKGPPAEKKDFWDSFSAHTEEHARNTGAPTNSSIGTSAMKGAPVGNRKEDGGWGDW